MASDTPITDLIRANPAAFAKSVEQWLATPLRRTLTPFWPTLTPEQQQAICLEAAHAWNKPLRKP